MSVLRMTLILAALTFASPAPAAVALTLGDALLSRPLHADDTLASEAATQRYFDTDALLTLGALALAGGALAAAARRPRAAATAPVRRRMSAPAAPFMRPRDAA
jgi:hypothetical protein